MHSGCAEHDIKILPYAIKEHDGRGRALRPPSVRPSVHFVGSVVRAGGRKEGRKVGRGGGGPNELAAAAAVSIRLQLDGMAPSAPRILSFPHLQSVRRRQSSGSGGTEHGWREEEETDNNSHAPTSINCKEDWRGGGA